MKICFLKSFWRCFWKGSRVRLWEHQSGYKTEDAATRSRNRKGRFIKSRSEDIFEDHQSGKNVLLPYIVRILIGSINSNQDRSRHTFHIEKTHLWKPESWLYGRPRFKGFWLYLLSCEITSDSVQRVDWKNFPWRALEALTASVALRSIKSDWAQA